MARIGFVGLGHMGLAMARNLVKAGHQVTGFDLQTQAIKKLVETNGIGAATLQEAAINQDIFITMLQTGIQVQDVCLGHQGLYQAASAGVLHIDCSTIDVASSRLLHEKALEQQLSMVDAPVSGGVKGAVAASLTFMTGGSEASFERAKPILQTMGKTIWHTGPGGSGQAAKICNNMILGVSMIAVSEAFVLAEHLGLSAQKLFDVVNSSSGQCWATSHYVPVAGILADVPANRDFEAGFTAAMMLKDLLLSQQAANQTGVTTPLGAHASSLYQAFNKAGFGALDFSAIIKSLEKQHG